MQLIAQKEVVGYMVANYHVFMMLDEAIRFYEELAKKNEKSARRIENKYEEALGSSLNYKCAAEFRQLAEWLRELKEYKKLVYIFY